MAYEIRLRKGESGTWAARNPILSVGEPGYETDTGKCKIGDGSSYWLELPYFVNEDEIAELIEEASLEGPVGPPGTNGTNGTNGVDGTDGADGANGTNGTNGQSVTVTLVPAASWPPAADADPLHLYFRVP